MMEAKTRDLPPSRQGKPTISAWISQFALAPIGIYFCPELEVRDGHGWAIMRYQGGQYAGGWAIIDGNYHPTREEAVARAEQMRAEAIAKHCAEIQKLAALRFGAADQIGKG